MYCLDFLNSCGVETKPTVIAKLKIPRNGIGVSDDSVFLAYDVLEK
jgi:hypothetical protein